MTGLPVTIIGGGFCGTMVAWHLSRRDDLPPLDITLYDHAGLHGRGMAYSTPFSEHLLNVPAGGMSALPDRPGHFLDWLRTRGGAGNAEAGGFYPRRLYGDYLTEFLRDAHKSSRHTVNAETGPGPLDFPGITVLATGTTQPLWPGHTGPLAHDFIIPHPYGPEFSNLLGRCGSLNDIIILGTGLSAVDAILSLHRAGYGGTITCVSRHGLWPAAHGPKNRPWHWRFYIDGLRPYSNTIWAWLPGSIKKFLLRHLTYWNVLRHRMPPQCHAVLQDLHHAGRLLTMAGTIQTIHLPSPDASISYKKSGKIHKISGDIIINCLGFIPYDRAPAPGHHVGEMCWTLGAPLFGTLIETTAVPELRAQAARVAAKIADFIKIRYGPAA